MPQYKFQCVKCGYERDEILSIADGDGFLLEQRCPEVVIAPEGEDYLCSGRYQRLIGGTSFKLAGRGWFRDGYK